MSKKLWAYRLVLALVLGVSSRSATAQVARLNSDEIPMERCDRLPMVKVRVGEAELRFLVDTGATTVLNVKSFQSGKIKEIQVTSWSGTAATSAREVSLPELRLGSHSLKQIKLPAIDLSPIGNACGGPVDGILGIDVLEKMGVTLDLKRKIASLEAPGDPMAAFDDMEKQMGPCTTEFDSGNAKEFRECLDPEIVLYTPHGEFRGREEVMDYLNQRYFAFAPHLKYTMAVHDVKLFGNALWYTYDYDLETPDRHSQGHGMAMCRKSEGRWRILNMHNSLRGEDAGPDSGKNQRR
jgi:ketosteroid isomerase-like protein